MAVVANRGMLCLHAPSYEFVMFANRIISGVCLGAAVSVVSITALGGSSNAPTLGSSVDGDPNKARREWMNKGNAASVWMPMWYMGRFVQYMPDLKGKMVIRPMPTFPGGKKSAGMGGTGTVVTTQSKNIELAKAFLAEAKLSKEGSIKTWSVLGFDPIRSDAWSDPAMTAPNKYTEYFGADIFSTLKNVVSDIGSINVGAKFPDAVSLVQKNVVFKVLKEKSQSASQALKEAADDLRSK